MGAASENPDIFTIGSCGRFFTIRWYTTGSSWGWRPMSSPPCHRYALDLGPIGLLFERYF